MTDKEAIALRHSVRNFMDKKIDADTVERIKQKTKELNAESGLHLQFLEDAGNTYNRLLSKTMGLASAPSAVACIGPDTEDLEEKIGYYGEYLVLYLQQLGLNTCWTGTFNKKAVPAEIDDGERLVITIAVGYGQDQGRPHRSKTAEQVTKGKKKHPEWFDEGVRMALLAPTAINQQRFTIWLKDDDSVEFIDNKGPFSKVDLGIVRCHFEIGAGRKTR